MSTLHIQNTLTRQKEKFEPINPPYVGLYCCGPTVYSDVHLGNTRTFISFDLVYRYLKFLGYKVRYVRNITDAGHLTNEAGEGKNRMEDQAKLEKLEPMEIVQKYTVGFHDVCRIFNISPPTIEPTATGHIVEQIEMAQQLIQNGVAYESNGSVYFDVRAYNEKGYNYGILSGRNIDELIAGYRDLDGQEEKRNAIDFALWKKASPEHIMQWNSPWGKGFPGWHLECSAMSRKYLGDTFDIHGGGMDLVPTHHTNEIAQNNACCKTNPANYWIHTNMLTVNGQKMSKSLGNSFLPHELFSGNHPLLDKGYTANVVRFFMLQTHYSSTLDFSNEALQAAEKGLKRLMAANTTLQNLKPTTTSTSNIAEWKQKCYDAMNDDFNTPILLAHLFESVRIINSINAGTETITETDLGILKKTFTEFITNVLGLVVEIESANNSANVLDGVVKILIEMRANAKQNKDFATSDKIRNELTKNNIQLKDSKDGTSWYLA